MALNKAVFKTRTISAIVFAAIMLSGLLWNRWSFLLLFTIIHFGCWHEFLKLLQLIFKRTIPVPAKFGFMLSGYALMLAFCGKAFTIGGYWISQALCLPLAIAGFVLLLIGIIQQREILPKLYLTGLLGMVYISLAWGTMLSLRQYGIVWKGDSVFVDNGITLPLVLIATIWINDTMQYIVGSLIGKTPFSKISPKKTWEGTIGGSLLAIVVVGFFAKLVLHWPLWQGFGVAAIAAVVGTAGDLLESYIKRKAGVKDSGNMLPGHGGFLDRFDSMLLATPFVWLFVFLLYSGLFSQ